MNHVVIKLPEGLKFPTHADMVRAEEKSEAMIEAMSEQEKFDIAFAMASVLGYLGEPEQSK